MPGVHKALGRGRGLQGALGEFEVSSGNGPRDSQDLRGIQPHLWGRLPQTSDCLRPYAHSFLQSVLRSVLKVLAAVRLPL